MHLCQITHFENLSYGHKLECKCAIGIIHFLSLLLCVNHHSRKRLEQNCMIWVLEIEYSIESLKSFKLSLLRYLEVLHTSITGSLHLVQAIFIDFFFPKLYRLYAVGGRDGSSCLKSVECFDPHTNKWTLCAQMSKRRGGVGVTTWNGFLYAIGGHDAPASNLTSRLSDCVER